MSYRNQTSIMMKICVKNKQRPLTANVMEVFYSDCESIARNYLERYKKATSRHSNQSIAQNLLIKVAQQRELLKNVSKADYKRMIWSLLSHLYGVQGVLFYRSRLRRELRRFIADVLGLKRWKDHDIREKMLVCDKAIQRPLIMLQLSPHESAVNIKEPSFSEGDESKPLSRSNIIINSAVIPGGKVNHHLSFIKTAEWLNKATIIAPLYFARHPRRTIFSLGHNHHVLLLKSDFLRAVLAASGLLVKNPGDNSAQITALSAVLLGACDLLNEINRVGKSKGFLSRQLVNFLNNTLYVLVKATSPLTASNYGTKIQDLKTDVISFIAKLEKTVPPPKIQINSAVSSTATLVLASSSVSILSGKRTQVSQHVKKSAIQVERRLKFEKELSACPALITLFLREQINVEISSLVDSKKIDGSSSRADRIQAIATYLKAFVKLGTTLRRVVLSYDGFFQTHLFNGSVLPKVQFLKGNNPQYIRELEEIIQVLDDHILNESPVNSCQRKWAPTL